MLCGLRLFPFSPNTAHPGDDDAYLLWVGLHGDGRSFFFRRDRNGSNDSKADQYIEVGGNDRWFDIRLEYVLPIGAAQKNAMMTYRLTKDMLTSGPTGGEAWNPLSSGITNAQLRVYSRYQNYEFDPGDLQRTIQPNQLAISYDNTDFPTKPSYGSRQFIGITRDFTVLALDEPWTFWEFETVKYVSLGKTDWARQRVLAFDAWTGDTPTWNETTLANVG